MISVFAAFIPDGSATIKPIAIGLAVGVFVDAFLVRMTLVPAILALLGRNAWWIPRTLDRALPSIDVEGQSLVKHVEQTEWDEANPGVVVRAEQLLLESSEGPVEVDLRVPIGTVWTVEHDDPRWRSALVWTISGWRKPDGGVLGVLGCVLPEESGFVRKKVRVVPASSRDEDELTVRQYLRGVLVAQSKSPWSPGDTVDRALDQAEAWLAPMAETESRSQVRLEDRQLGHLSAIERQLVALSAAASQQPEMVVVQDADAGLGTVEMSWFSGVCHEIVDTTDTTVVLVGQRVTAEQGGPEPEPPVTAPATEPAPDADRDPAVRAEGGRA
jgi:putative drug exporter of the RND superfamily